MNRGFANIAIIIAVVVIVGGLGWWYLNQSSTSSVPLAQPSNNSEDTNVITEQPQTTPQPMQRPAKNTEATKMYESPNGYSMQIPADVEVAEQPAISVYSAITYLKGDFGTLCISPGYGCGGVGTEGWAATSKVLTTASGEKITFTVWRRDGDNRVEMVMTAINSRPVSLNQDAQIQLGTTEDKLSIAESIVTSLQFLQ